MMENKVKAFVCEINEDSVKMYEWKNQLIEVKKTDFDDDIELGKFYQLDENEKFCEYRVSRSDMKKTDLKIFVKDGVVHVKDLAFAPSEADLNTNGLSQYRNTAYSYRLQLLNDPNDLFCEFLKSEVAMATVKFAPTDKTVFEVVEVEEVPEVYKNSFSPLEYLTVQAPWNVLQNERVGQKMPMQRHEGSNVKYTGVCIGTYIENKKVIENEEVIEKKVVMNILFSPQLGLARTAKEVEIGKWCKFEFYKTCQYAKNEDGSTKKIPFKMSLVAEVSFLEEEVPTRVVKKNRLKESVDLPVFTLCFLLEPEILEPAVNALKFWGKRFIGLETDAHFDSISLGKVKIPRIQSRKIIERIEEYHQEKEPSLYKKWKHKQICVEVDVEPCNKSFGSWMKSVYDPAINDTLFVVTNLVRIAYFNGGKTIYPRPQEQCSSTEEQRPSTEEQCPSTEEQCPSTEE